MSWIWRAKFVLIQPSVPVLCQYSSGFTAVEKLILHTCSSAFWWTASNSYMEGRWWRCKHFHTGIFTPQLIEIQKPEKQQQMYKCTLTRRSHMEKVFVFVPPADRKLQFEHFQLRRDPKMYTRSQIVRYCRLSFSAGESRHWAWEAYTLWFRFKCFF